MRRQRARVYRIVINPWEQTATITRYDASRTVDIDRTYTPTRASARRLGRYLRATDSHIAMSPLGIEYIFLNAY